jgi:hypothetical protein
LNYGDRPFSLYVSKGLYDRLPWHRARGGHDRPIVLTCDVDLERLRQRHGSGKVILNGNVISIKGEVPATALRSRIGLSNVPETPIEVARWINQVLGVKYLDRLDPKEHRDVFETALYDPHPHIAKVARRLTQGMGYEKIIW